VIDFSGGYALTYDDSTATKDANLKLMKKDLARTKLSNIPIGLTFDLYFLHEYSIQPYLLAGVGIDMWKTEPAKGSGKSIKFTDVNGKAGLGVNFWLSENIALDIQGKITYELSNLSADKVPGIDFKKWDQRAFRGYVEPSIGFTYLFGKAKDSDNDGVPDKHDKCPDTPFGCIVDKNGCPLDADGDGAPEQRAHDIGRGAGGDVEVAAAAARAGTAPLEEDVPHRSPDEPRLVARVAQPRRDGADERRDAL